MQCDRQNLEDEWFLFGSVLTKSPNFVTRMIVLPCHMVKKKIISIVHRDRNNSQGEEKGERKLQIQRWELRFRFTRL